MSLTIPASELARASSVLSPIAKSRFKPILECVLLDASKDRVVLTANNLELSAAVVIQNCEVAEPSKTLIRAEKLFRFASNYPKSNISISPNGTKTIIATESAKLALPTEDVKDFPIRLQPKDKPITVPSAALISGCRVAFAADKAQSNTNYVMSGVALVIHKGNLYMVACEGHNIAAQKLRSTNLPDAKYVMPIPAANALASLGEGDCEIAFAQSAIGFRSEGLEFASALFEANYPNVFNVQLPSVDATVAVNREALIQALRPTVLVRDGQFVTDCYVQVSDGTLSLSAETQLGKCDSQIPCETHGQARTCFNPNFLIDCASSFPTSSAITFKLSKLAGQMESEDGNYYTYISGMAPTHA